MPADLSYDPRQGAPGQALPAIHTLWVGPSLGPLERLCLTSWVRQGHDVVLHAYDRLDVPRGVTVMDAAGLCPADRIFRHRRTGSLAVFADLYRVLILDRFDAVWADADIFLVRPLPSATALLASERAPARRSINNALMRLPRGHPLLCSLLSLAACPAMAIPWRQPRKLAGVVRDVLTWRTFDPSVLPWGTFGYVAIQRHVARHGFDGLILGPETCLTPDRAPLFTPVENPDALLAPPLVYLHLYRSQQTIDLSRPVPGSVYARLWQRAGIDPDSAGGDR